ncbi:MAG: hypothetical protein ACXAAO_13280 [Candidatus Thorarchaeota archaeon]|jgi:hypothetical protein
MKNKRNTIIVLAIVLIVPFLVALPVKAVTTDIDYYDSRNENWGDWNPVDYEALEFIYSGVYKFECVFVFTSVAQDGDAYKLDIDYNTLWPGWPFHESILVYYRWGSSGGWTWHLTLDLNSYDDQKVILDASNSRLEVKFYDAGQGRDLLETTWFFGHDGPILWVQYI